MSTIKANFDGQVFVPREAVKLPVGTQVEVVLPTTAPVAKTSTPAPSADENAEWSEIRAEIAATEPAFPTVEDALRHCLVTWNARHFAGKLPIPVFTPQEWMRRQTP
jgi:hypothetical protein